jgi:hypothetical protein
MPAGDLLGGRGEIVKQLARRFFQAENAGLGTLAGLLDALRRRGMGGEQTGGSMCRF